MGTTYSKPPGPIIIIHRSKILSGSQVQFITLFWRCVAPFSSHGKHQKFGAEKLISWAKPAHIDCFAINFTVKSYILSTGGDAVSGSEYVVMGLLRPRPLGCLPRKRPAEICSRMEYTRCLLKNWRYLNKTERSDRKIGEKKGWKVLGLKIRPSSSPAPTNPDLNLPLTSGSPLF